MAAPITGTSYSPPGPPSIEFWSTDGVGNVETPHKTASFTITAPAVDTTAPTTTSDAVATYYNTAQRST